MWDDGDMNSVGAATALQQTSTNPLRTATFTLDGFFLGGTRRRALIIREDAERETGRADMMANMVSQLSSVTWDMIFLQKQFFLEPVGVDKCKHRTLVYWRWSRSF